jgi:Ran GTPase-activating protein (RanGAP) involved in mRNA processing and transport
LGPIRQVQYHEHLEKCDFRNATSLRDFSALGACRSLTSLDISGCRAAVPSHVSEVLQENVSLVKFTFGHAMTPVTLETSMTTANVSGHALGAAGAVILAAFLPKCKDLVSLTMHKYALPIHDIKTKPELDLSGKELNELDAIVIAALIRSNPRLRKLVLSENRILTKQAGQALSNALAADPVLTELDISNNGYRGCDSAGFAESFAGVVGSNGSLSKLDISGNSLFASGAKYIAEALEANVSSVEERRVVPNST